MNHPLSQLSPIEGKNSNSNAQNQNHPLGSKDNDHTISHSTVSTVPFSNSQATTDYQLQADQNDYQLEMDPFSDTLSQNTFSTSDGVDILSGTDGKKDPNSSMTTESNLDSFRHWLRHRSGAIVTDRLYKRGSLFFILVSSILLGIRTLEDVWNHHDDGAASSLSMTILVRLLHGAIECLLVVATAEVILQSTFYQNKTMSKGWVMLDVLVVGCSWFLSDTILILRGFRLLRALRKASGLGMDVKLAVKAVLRVFPKLLAVMVLVGLNFYIFAVLFTDLFRDLHQQQGEEAGNNGYQNGQDACFRRLDVSALTLFQVMTGGRLWSDLAAEVMQEKPWAWIPFVAFCFVTITMFGGILIAVACEAVNQVSNERLWKSLETRNSADNFTSSTMVHHGNSNSFRNRMHEELSLAKFEEKIEKLSDSVDQLVRMQFSLQRSLGISDVHNTNFPDTLSANGAATCLPDRDGSERVLS